METDLLCPFIGFFELIFKNKLNERKYKKKKQQRQQQQIHTIQ